jgi:hypothetical protein
MNAGHGRRNLREQSPVRRPVMRLNEWRGQACLSASSCAAGNAACDDAGMLMAVSLAGRGNRQTTTWVTCILAASAKADLDAMAAVPQRWACPGH